MDDMRRTIYGGSGAAPRAHAVDLRELGDYPAGRLKWRMPASTYATYFPARHSAFVLSVYVREWAGIHALYFSLVRAFIRGLVGSWSDRDCLSQQSPTLPLRLLN